jgi:hypothetical protein
MKLNVDKKFQLLGFFFKHNKNSLTEVNLNPGRYEWRLERK